MKKKFLALTLALTMGISLAGCGNTGSKNDTANAAKTETEALGDEETTGDDSKETNTEVAEVKSAKDTLIIGMGNAPTTLDFANGGTTDSAFQILSMIGESLLKQDASKGSGVADMVTDNSITEAVEWDDDYLGVTFKLRQGIQMQDDTELNADDVVFCLQRYEGAQEYDCVDFANIKAVDAYTVYVKLSSYNSVILNRLGTRPIFSKEAYEACGNDGVFFTEGYISCGPYKIESWTSGDSAALKKFDSYYSEKPFIDNVICRHFSDSSVAMMELQSGGVDMITGPSFNDYQDVESGTYADQFSTLYAPSTQTYAVYFDMASEKLQPLELRQAIMYAMNREEISDGAFNGWGDTCYSMHGISYMDLTAYDQNTWPYKTDLEKAKELMKAAGLESGVTLKLITHNASGYYQKIAEIFANQLAQIGITVEINVYEPATFKSYQNATDGSWDISITSPEVSYATTIGSWFANGAVDSSMHAGELPAEGYKEAYDLGMQLIAATDESQVKEFTGQLEDKYFNELLWWCPVQNSGVYSILNSKLTGINRIWTYLDITKAYFTE